MSRSRSWPWRASVCGRVVLYSLPLLAAWLAEREVGEKLQRHEQSEMEGAVIASPKIPVYRLETLLQECLDLKRSHESKATLYMGGIGVVLSLVGGSSDDLQLDLQHASQWPLTFSLLFAVVHLFAAALSAYAVVGTRTWTRFTLSWEAYLAEAADHVIERQVSLVWAVKFNELRCVVMSNYVTAARNHTLFGLFFLLVVLVVQILGAASVGCAQRA